MTVAGRPVAWVLAAALLAGTGTLAVRAGATDSSSEAVSLVQRMRDAPATMWFEGEVRVVWHDRGARRDLSVAVTGDHGAVEVRSGDATVFDHGRRTYFKGLEGRTGWSTALLWPVVERVPDPDHRFVLRTRDGSAVAGRSTQVVEAVRRNRVPALRMYVDVDTGLLLRRDVLDHRGEVVRSLTFVDLTIENGRELQAPEGVRARRVAPLDRVPSGYTAPDELAGFVLVGRVRDERHIELLYHDGMFAVTVHQQRGVLDWAGLPKGGEAIEVDGKRARRYAQPGVDVLVWEREGTVFTFVSDAPRDLVEAMAVELEPNQSAVEKVVNFVLGPFGWD